MASLIVDVNDDVNDDVHSSMFSSVVYEVLVGAASAFCWIVGLSEEN